MDDELLYSGLEVDDDIGKKLREASSFNFVRTSIYPEFHRLVESVLVRLPETTSKTENKDRTALTTILANLYDLRPGRYLRLSLDNNFYSKVPKRYNPQAIGYRAMERVVNGLHELDLITMRKGWNDRQSGSRFQTRILPSAELLELFEPLKSIKDLISDVEGAECILMRSVKERNGKKITSAQLIDYEDTEETHSMRQRLRAINTYLNEIDLVRLDGQSIYKRQLYRIFNNGSFDDGGRFYGGFWQQLNEAERGHLGFKGRWVEEFDYKGLHIRMLYALKGIDIGDDDPYQLPDLPREYRDFFKMAVLVIINASDRANAIAAIRAEAKKKTPHLSGSATRLVNLFIEHHKPIAEYFFSGYGVKLQRLDSDILEDVLYNLTIQGIPALPVHDSIVVPVGNRDLVINEMTTAYKKRLKYEPRLEESSNWHELSKLSTLYSS